MSTEDPMSHPRRSWTVARHRMRVDGVGVLMLWAGFVVAVGVLLLVVAGLGTVTISAWEQATQVPRWFAGAMGVYLTAVYLPLYIAHGETRRDVAVQSSVFAVAYAAILSVLMAAGYGIETLVYGLADWPQVLQGDHLYGAPDQYPMILLQYWLVFLVWMAGGALLGGAFYRRGGLGLLMLPVALLMALVVEVALGAQAFGPLPPPVVERLPVAIVPDTLVGAVGACLAVAAVGAALTWAVVRDLPVRNRVA